MPVDRYCTVCMPIHSSTGTKYKTVNHVHVTKICLFLALAQNMLVRQIMDVLAQIQTCSTPFRKVKRPANF